MVCMKLKHLSHNSLDFTSRRIYRYNCMRCQLILLLCAHSSLITIDFNWKTFTVYILDSYLPLGIWWTFQCLIAQLDNSQKNLGNNSWKWVKSDEAKKWKGTNAKKKKLLVFLFGCGGGEVGVGSTEELLSGAESSQPLPSCAARLVDGLLLTPHAIYTQKLGESALGFRNFSRVGVGRTEDNVECEKRVGKMNIRT